MQQDRLRNPQQDRLFFIIEMLTGFCLLHDFFQLLSFLSLSLCLFPASHLYL